MKKLILTLAYLVCGSMAYGMDAMNTAIAQADWNQVATILKDTGEYDPQLTHHIAALSNTDITLLNQAGKDRSFLLPQLILHAFCQTNINNGCVGALNVLTGTEKLKFSATDQDGNLVCNAHYLSNDHKRMLLTYLNQHSRCFPLRCFQNGQGKILFQLDTDTPAHPDLPQPISLGQPKPSKPRSYISADNKFRLAAAIVILTGTILAANAIYKWRTKKDVDVDEDDKDTGQVQESHEHPKRSS